jgi:hypothetical protein
MNARINQITTDLLGILTRIEKGMVYNGLTVDGCASYTEESHDIFAHGIKALRIGLTRLNEENQALPDPEAEAKKLDPAANLYQQILALDPKKAASVSKIKTNGSSTEVTFAINPVLGRINFTTDPVTPTEVTCVEGTTD